MSDFYLPQRDTITPVNPPVQDISATVQSTAQSVQQAQNMDAAKAFQDHLNRGYSAMVETLKEVPPQIASTLPDPGAYSDSEDKRVAWYGMLNDAIAKTDLVNKAATQTSEPDALRAEAAKAPLSAESQKIVGNQINSLEQNQTEKKIQGLFSPDAKQSTAQSAPVIDTKTGFGRNLKIKLSRMEPYADTIQSAAQKAGIPPQLVMAVASQESSGNENAVSKTGVKGTMMVTDGTFKDMASKYPDANLTDRTNPEQSYMAGALYLGELTKQFDGNIPAALAAYNGGSSAVKSAMEQYPTDWKDHLKEFFPASKAAEVKDYIDSVGKNYSALGGGTIAAKKQPMTQTEANTAALNVDPKILVNPAFQAYTGGLKTDATLADKQSVAQTKANQSNERINIAKERLKNTLDYQGYQKVDKYGAAIKDIAPAALAIKRIDNLAGGLDGTGDIAGAGLGAGAFKNFLMTSATPEARDMRLALADLFPQISHAQFGSRLTSTEVGLLGQQLGTSWLSDSDTFRKAMRNQREDVWQKLNDRWAALPDDAKKELYDQGVANPDMFGDFKSNIAGKSSTPGAHAAENQVTVKSGKKFTIVAKGK